MSVRSLTTVAAKPVLNPASGLLQRKCDCGQRTIVGGECEECRKDKGQLQRHSAGASNPGTAPPIVHEVLRSPGQPLDTQTRSFFEPRFGQDFSHVRVHTDSRAAESARAVNALAYTVGHNVVFGAGRYAPSAKGGAWLLAHELAHTIQQKGAPVQPLAAFTLDSESTPSEYAANSAADAVLAGRAVPTVGGSGIHVQRQRITSIDRVNNDEKLVHFDNGTRMRVRRIRSLSEETRRVGWARATPGIDQQRVWLEVEWCAGQNHGTVRIGANIPEQVINLVVQTVTSGGDINNAVRGINLTPFVELNTLQSGSFQLSASGEVTVNMQGRVTGGEGRIGVSRGPLDVDINVGSREVGGRPDVHVVPEVQWTPGRGTPTQECRRERKRIVENTRFECQSERDIAPSDVPEAVPVHDEHTRYIYFEYARDVVHPSSAANITALAGDLRDGFQISRIRAFTSPEGPMPRGQGGFVGNDELSRKRGAAAARVATESCRTAGVADPNSCFVGGTPVTPTGESELYTLTRLDARGRQQEVEGAPLAEHAADEFLMHPEEAHHRTPTLTAQLTAPGTTSRQKADLVYPLLRRAEITLVRNRTETRTRHIEGRTETGATTTCPDDLISAAFPRALEGLGRQ